MLLGSPSDESIASIAENQIEGRWNQYGKGKS